MVPFNIIRFGFHKNWLNGQQRRHILQRLGYWGVGSGPEGGLLLPLELGGSEKRIEREIRQAPRNQNPNPGVVFAPFFFGLDQDFSKLGSPSINLYSDKVKRIQKVLTTVSKQSLTTSQSF